MRTLRSAACLLLSAAGALLAEAAGDPTLLSLVMPDAKSISGINIEQSRTSPFGRLLLARIEADGDLDRLAEATGFDPRLGLTEIVAASSADGSKLALVRGTFQPSRIATFAKATGSSIAKYHGYAMVDGQTEHPGQSLVFLDASTVALGDTQAVKAVIDRRVAGTQFTGAIAQKALEVSSSSHAWFVSSMSPTDLPSSRSNPMELVRQFSGGVTFGQDTVTLDADALTPSVEDARTLRDFLKMLASKGIKFFDAAQFDTAETILRIHLSLPEADAEQLLLNPPELKGPARP